MLGSLRQREPRTKVLVPCRMNVEGRWADSCIHNVSSRGMLVASDHPPAPGAYVDIRRGSLVIIGRVIWRKDRFFGVRTQDRISAKALVSEPRLANAPARPAATSERRSENRLSAEGRVARRVEHNRHRSAIFQFASLAIAVGLAAFFFGSEVYRLLGSPLSLIGHALDGAAP